MNKLSSEVLDFYDDTKGVIFSRRFPSPELVPPFLKEAQWVTPEVRAELPDDLFALVLNEDGGTLKKFAMNDKANTMLSVIYLLDNGTNKIPADLAKTAATNLVQGCLWYSIEPPEALSKLANGDFELMDPNVNTEKTAALAVERPVQRKAVPSQDKYPLDSYRDTIKAAEYFSEYAERLAPSVRREFAQNLTPRAEELGIPLSKEAQLYSSDQYAPKSHIAHQMQLRVEKLAGAPEKTLYGKLFDKMASLTPGVAAESLMLLDQQTGLDDHWDGSLMDPYASVLQVKSAQENYMFHDNIAPISGEDLHNMANTAQSLIEKAFDKDFYKTFRSDPIGVFKSLPLPEKRVLIRLKATERM